MLLYFTTLQYDWTTLCYIIQQTVVYLISYYTKQKFTTMQYKPLHYYPILWL